MVVPSLSLDQRSMKSVDEPKKKRKKQVTAGTATGTGGASTSQGVAVGQGSSSKKVGSSGRAKAGNAPTYSAFPLHEASTSSLHLPNSSIYGSVVTASTDSLALEASYLGRLLKPEDASARRGSATDAAAPDAKGKGRASPNTLGPGVTYTTTTSSNIVPIKKLSSKAAINNDIADAVKNAGLAPPGSLRPPLQERGTSQNNVNTAHAGLNLSRTVSANSAANSINDASSTQGTAASTSSAAHTASTSSKPPVKKKKKKVKAAPEQHTSSSRHPASSQAILGSALTNAQLDVRRPTAGPPPPVLVPAAPATRPSQQRSAVQATPAAVAAPLPAQSRRREERSRRPEVSAPVQAQPAAPTRATVSHRAQSGSSAAPQHIPDISSIPLNTSSTSVAAVDPAEHVTTAQAGEEAATTAEPPPPAWSAPLSTITLAYTPLHAYITDFETAETMEEPAAPDSPTTAAFMAALGPGTAQQAAPTVDANEQTSRPSAASRPQIPNSPPPEFRSRPPTPEAAGARRSEAHNEDEHTDDDLPIVDPERVQIRERGYASSENEVDLVISQGRGLDAAPDDMPDSDDADSTFGDKKRRWQIRHWEAWRREGVEPLERWRRFAAAREPAKPAEAVAAVTISPGEANAPLAVQDATRSIPLAQGTVAPEPLHSPPLSTTEMPASDEASATRAPPSGPRPVLVPPKRIANPPVTTETTARVIADEAASLASPVSDRAKSLVTSAAQNVETATSLANAEVSTASTSDRPDTLSSNVRDSLSKFPSLGTVRRARLKRFEAQRQNSKTLGSVLETSPSRPEVAESPASTSASPFIASPAAVASSSIAAAALSPSPLPPTRWSGIRPEALGQSQSSPQPIATNPSATSPLPSLSRLQAMLERRDSKSQDRNAATETPASGTAPNMEEIAAVTNSTGRSESPTANETTKKGADVTPKSPADQPAPASDPAPTSERAEQPAIVRQATLTRSKPAHQLAKQLSAEIDNRREEMRASSSSIPLNVASEQPKVAVTAPLVKASTSVVAEVPRPASPDRAPQLPPPASPTTPKAKRKDARLTNRISRLLRPAAGTSAEASTSAKSAASSKPVNSVKQTDAKEETPLPVMTLPRAPPRITTDPLSTDNLRKLSRHKVRSPSFHSSQSLSSSSGDEEDDTSLSSVRDDKSDSDSDSADDESTTRKPDSSLVSYPSGSAPPSTSRETVFASTNAREAAAASWRRSEDGRRYSAILSRPLSIKRKPPPVPAKRWGGVWDKTSVQDALLQDLQFLDTPEEQNARAGPSGARPMPGSLPQVAEEEPAWEVVGQTEPSFTPRLPGFSWETVGRDPPDRALATSATTRALNFLGMEHPFPPPPHHPANSAYQYSYQPHPEARRLPPPPPNALQPNAESSEAGSSSSRAPPSLPDRPASIRSFQSAEGDQSASPSNSPTSAQSPKASVTVQRRPSAPSGSTLQRATATRRPQSLANPLPRPEHITAGSLPSSPSASGHLSDTTRISLNSRPRHVYSSSVPNATIAPSTPTRIRRPLPVPPTQDQHNDQDSSHSVARATERYSPEASVNRALPTISEPLDDVTDLEVMLSRLEETGESSPQVVKEMLGITRGATAEEIDSLPVGRVELERRRIDKNGKLKQKLSVIGIAANKCDICLLQFKEDELAVVLPLCCHVYHAEPCIRSYLRTQNSCPTCQTPIM